MKLIVLLSIYMIFDKEDALGDKIKPALETQSSVQIKEPNLLAEEITCSCKNEATFPMRKSCSITCNHGTAGPRRANHEVFLGGSCNPTNWRVETMQKLEKHKITYYNPQVDEWHAGLIAIEAKAKEEACVQLFVIEEKTRNVVGILEVSQLAGLRESPLMVVINPYKPNQKILDESVSNEEYCELTNGLMVLQYLLERQGIPLFKSLDTAIDCTSKVLRGVNYKNAKDKINPSKISFGDHETDVTKVMGKLQSLGISDSVTLNLAEAFVTLNHNQQTNVPIAELKTAVEDELEKRVVVKLLGTSNEQNERTDFEQFCAAPSGWVWLGSPSSVAPSYDKRDLYIGAVGEDLNWLTKEAVPFVKNLGLSLHTPSATEYVARVLPLELQRMKNSRLIVLVVPQDRRGIAIMTLAAHLIGLRANLVLCIRKTSNDPTAYNKKLTEQAIKDYNRGRSYLSDMAKREKIPIFEDVTALLNHLKKI